PDAGNPFPFGTSPFGFSNLNTFDVKSASAAGFADGTFDLTPTFRLLGGVRYTSEHKTADGLFLTDAPVSPINPVPLDTDKTWNATTWRAGGQWDVTP